MGADFQRAWNECPFVPVMLALALGLGVKGPELEDCFISGLGRANLAAMLARYEEQDPNTPAAERFVEIGQDVLGDPLEAERRIIDAIRSKWSFEDLLALSDSYS
jgi:hypothetical protein